MRKRVDFLSGFFFQSTSLILEELLSAKLRQTAAMKAQRCPALAHTGQREEVEKKLGASCISESGEERVGAMRVIMIVDSTTHRAFLHWKVKAGLRHF